MAAAFDAFVDTLQLEGTALLSPKGVADALDVPLGDLAATAGVHRNTLRTHPDSVKLQSYLRDLLRAMSAASDAQPDPLRLRFWFKNAPIPSFAHKTAFQLVAEGRTDDLVAYLQSVESGYVG